MLLELREITYLSIILRILAAVVLGGYPGTGAGRWLLRGCSLWRRHSFCDPDCDAAVGR